MNKYIIIGGSILVVLLIVFGFKYSQANKEKKYQSFMIACLKTENQNTKESCDQAWRIAQGLGINTFQEWSDYYNQGSKTVR